MAKSLEELQSQGVLMVNSHFDYGNGYHGTVYLNPHRLFQQPGTIWRFAQDLIARLPVDRSSSRAATRSSDSYEVAPRSSRRIARP